MVLAVAGLVLTTPAQSAVDMDELSDLAARIQFAVFEKDFDTLDRLAAELADERARSDLKPLLHYQAAYAAYRAGELAPQAGRADSPYLERCEQQALAAAEEAEEEFADALALAGACAALDASRNLTALLSATRARRHLRAARELEPDNPRVLLLAAVSLMRQPSLAEGWGTPAQLLDRAAERYASALPPARGRPDWGEAETGAVRAELSMAAGEVLAARDAAEHALMLAPDYRRARAVLEKLSACAR
ncbi:hypothetical protein [Lentisalinibacter salinarum]|uniref:hypothetical protein n=1 Tax=Lentisalinibacter salinarum TaxID=2992239 RepID=UPI003865BDD9